MPILITDHLTLPIDEGMKKFTFSLFRHAAKSGHFRILSSPDKLPIASIEQYQATKWLFGRGLRQILGRTARESVLYIPASSTTLASFLRAWLIKWMLPGSQVTLVSLQKRWHRKWETPFLRAGRFTIVTFSQAACDEYAAMGLHAIALSPGVDGRRFRPVASNARQALREKRGWKTDDQVVLHVGHIRASRNLTALLDLAYAGYHVTVIGSSSTPYEEATARQLEQAGIEVIASFQTHVEEWYQAADCYVFPVRQESGAIEFPLSILEAMACNLPVVTTPFGGLVDAFQETACFQYYRRKDRLVDRIEKVLGAENCCNRDVVLHGFTWEKTFDRLLSHLKVEPV